MVKCPRCGFEQPTDRFCAKCGIAMDRYRPKTPPVSARYGTPIFMFGVVGLFVVGLVSYLIYKSKTLDQADAVSEVAAPLANPSPAATSQPPPAQKAMALALPETTPLKDIAPDGEKTPGEKAPAVGEGARPAATAADTATSGNQNVKIEFDVVNRDVLERLVHDGEGSLEIGRYGLSIVPNFKTNYQNIHGDPNFKSLASETRGLTQGQPSLVFRGGKEPKSNETIGFFIDVTPTRAVERAVEYKISIKRSLPEVTPAGEVRVTSQNYEETTNVPRGAAVVFAGLLPRKQLVEGEDELYKSNVLSALLEPAFQKGDEEFVIVVNPQMNEIAN